MYTYIIILLILILGFYIYTNYLTSNENFETYKEIKVPCVNNYCQRSVRTDKGMDMAFTKNNDDIRSLNSL